MLRAPYENGEITRDSFKQIIKKVADKVVRGYQNEDLPPPDPDAIPEKQTSKIEKLARDYVAMHKKA